MSLKMKYIKIACNLFAACVVILLLIFVVPRLIHFFFPFVIGYVLSLLGLPMVRFLEKRIKIHRKYGTVIMIVSVIAVIVLLCYGIITALVYGLKEFADYLPTLSATASFELKNAFLQLQEWVYRVPYAKNIDFSNMGEKASALLLSSLSNPDHSVVSTVSSVVTSLPDMLVGVVVALLATYYFIADRERIAQWLRKSSSKELQAAYDKVYNEIIKVVLGYIKAQLKIMVVIYVILLIGLMILRVHFAWVIGFGIAFLDMLPVFGTGTVLIPWAIIKILSGEYWIALGMVLLYIVTLLVHQLLQPKMVGASIGMNAFVTLLFMYVGYQFGGVVGMILAIPIGMLIVYFYKAGGFDTLIWCIREVWNDFNKLRKIEVDSEKKEDYNKTK